MKNIKEMVETYLKTNSPDETILPLLHTTTRDIFVNKIICENQLSSKPCGYHNDENLLFFFYGKCSYVNKAHQNVDIIHNHPITFLFNYDKLEKYTFERLVSFDSGGYVEGKYIYDKEINPDLDIFVINNPTKNDIIGLLQILYQNNNNYLESNLTLFYTIDEHPLSPCIQGFDSLLKKIETSMDTKTGFGEQALTFELQIKTNNMLLEPDAIFIPNDMCNSDAAINCWINKFPSAKIETYKKKKFCNDIYSEMKSSVEKYIRENMEINNEN